MNKNYLLSKKDEKILRKLKGPIVIFGAGGFVGINILLTILNYRNDVYGISSNSGNNWRFSVSKIPLGNLRNVDLNKINQVEDLISELKPKTIFNLAAYGAYPKQKEYEKIYQTNVISTINLIEVLKKKGFNSYVHAGSQSEYGLNSKAPKEDSELIPNSHYAVSKTANYYTIKYYGKIEKLPVVHLRLYSAFGPWEEPDRLIPALLSEGRFGKFPKLVDSQISRDFIYISDIVRAFIFAGNINKKNYGEVFNIASGKKTTIRSLTSIIKKILKIKESPKFGSMDNRDWDLTQWYGNIKKTKKILGWEPKVTLEDGIKDTINWQLDIDYDNAYWNRTDKI